MHDRNYSRALSVITREQYSFVSHEPNMRVKRKIPRGTNHYSCFFVNLDVSCSVCAGPEKTSLSTHKIDLIFECFNCNNFLMVFCIIA